MKTQITIETTPEQELVIGLAQTGKLQKAKQVEVKDYFENEADLSLGELNDRVEQLMGAIGDVRPSAKSDDNGV